ncbi:hypothetical protein [Gilvimarinus xylanilyticus]|uniref:Uncharacterized protein n=1 Tax=Gilvimarinus xylanilyticus TaxID=2944139 RepID=A0A9X2HWY3_9GAMM|nr:hypothetical protein [Gilvimarinus xylanilyticus]MCP8899650.1 hypothetical protein [Gilvimarinus xylanilyticus]
MPVLPLAQAIASAACCGFALAALIACVCLVPQARADYYRASQEGADALYNPLNSFSHYAFDTLQMPDNFDQHNLGDRFNELFDELGNPDAAIQDEGGWGRFINRQLLPYDSDYARDWPTALPNYALHLFGGGVVYRRDLEYYRAHGYRYPQFAAIATALASELSQEAVEKKTSTDDDPIADFYVFRPLGVWLFADDERAAYIEKHLQPEVWPHLIFYDPSSDTLRNAGINYVVRPQFLSFDSTEFFVYMGMNSLVGLSHSLSGGNTLSWGAGIALTRIYYRSGVLRYESRPSLGVFGDRDGNLLWSVIYNGTEALKLRVNVYPWKSQTIKFGLGLGVTDDDRAWLGFTLNMPMGLGRQF